MEEMEICFISLTAYGYFNSNVDAYPGGAQRQLYLISNELKDNHRISFIVGDYGQSSYKEIDGISLYSTYQPNSSASFFENLGQFRKLFATMRHVDPDVFVFRGYPKKAAILFALSRFCRTRFVYNVANDADITTRPDKLNHFFSSLFKYSLTNSDCVIAQTIRQANILQEKYDTPSNVVPNGYPRTKEKPLYGDRDYFLWVGSMDKLQKRPHLYLDLAEKLPDQEFILVGPEDSGDYSTNILNKAESHQNVTYVGYVDPDKIHEYYRSAIALVNTSAYEGFPNVFLEAWRYGTPVISLSIDPQRFLKTADFGYANGDISRLVGIASELANSRDKWRESSRISREYFEKNYDISSVARQYESIMRDAVVNDQ